VLLGGAAMALLGFVVAWFIKAVPLRGGTPVAAGKDSEDTVVEAPLADAVS
jgi:hypothetical protein